MLGDSKALTLIGRQSMQVGKKELAAIALITATLPGSTLAFDDREANAESTPEMAYPSHPLTLVTGFPPGANTDSLAKLIAKHMAAPLGQKVIVDYKPGASGNIGAQAVARAKPDGYTLYLSGRPNTIHKTMYAHMEYDFSRDLVPVGLVATVPYVMVAGPHSPLSSMEDVLRLAKAYPGGVSCASGGMGSTSHLLCELLQQDMGINLQHIPYRGAAPALADLIGGRIDLQIAPVAAALPLIHSGKLRPIVVMSRLRVPALSTVPTIEEAGVPGLDLGAWHGLVAPAGTPADVIAKLNKSINTALQDPELRETMERMAFIPPPAPNTPEGFKAFIAEETERWTSMLHTRKIRPVH